ncbi:MAG TPA: sugar kinase [Armatimonadota bacterium]|jgi:sugar/nucleoside kinase (ribokinase family)
MAQVTCLGILVADLVGKPVDVYPERGKLVLVDQLELHTGGCAANTGVGLARIGIDTAVMGKVGSDGLGDFMVGYMQRNSVDARGVVRDAKVGTSGTMVMVHGDGERSFIHYLGANACLSEADVNFDLIKGSKILHVAGTFLMPGFDGEPTARILKKAQEMGITTTLDTAWDSKGQWMNVIKPCLPYIDYIVPSIAEAQQVTGKTDPSDVAKVFMDHGVKVVGLKMGEEGCYIRSADEEIRIPRFNVKAIDALGAGDAFAAGFLTGIVQGWDLEKTGRFANATGAHCVMALGATTGIKSMEEILAFMNAQG